MIALWVLKNACKLLILLGSTSAFTSIITHHDEQRRMGVTSLRMNLDDIPVLKVDAEIPLVRMLVISDTHGLEEHLFEKGFPDVDILVHCGDWWSARGSKDRLDRVLAEQAHHIPRKIVVRGNHDPGKYKFSQSEALYVTEATLLDFEGLKIEIRPYDTCGQLSEDVDILLSHEPPRGLLDMVYSGHHVGDTRLLESCESSPIKPKLWCFGHIHESRGIISHRFADTTQSTLIVNASSENSYKTKQVLSGPVLVHIGKVTSG